MRRFTAPLRLLFRNSSTPATPRTPSPNLTTTHKSNNVTLLLGGGVAALLQLACPSALGQEALPRLEEVTVTAQRRAEPLQETPISLAAFGEERLEVEGVTGLEDIRGLVPGLTIDPFPINNGTLRVFIRGIGISDAQITQDPPVGVYLDGVYIARSTGAAMDIADLSRVEVLRGPQGTLYGRNTTGGAINLITARPNTEEITFKQTLSAGSRNLASSKSTLNLPVTDHLAVKFGALFQQQDGYVDNTGPGEDFGDREVAGYRLDLRWQATDDLTVDYAYDRSEVDYTNNSYQHIRPRTPVQGSQADLIDSSANTQYTTGFADELATIMPFLPSYTEIEGHSLTLTQEFDGFQLKYLGAYRSLFDQSYADLGGGAGLAPGQDPHGLSNASKRVFRLDTGEYCGQAAQFVLGSGQCTPTVRPIVDQEQWSHEFQVTGETFDQRLEYIAGLYYFREEAVEDNGPLHHQLSGPANLGVPNFEDTFGNLPILGGVLGDILGPNTTLRAVNLLSQRYDIENEAFAAFGQFTWTPPLWQDRLHLTLGARHSEDTRTAIKNQTDITIIETAALSIDGSMALCSDGTSTCRNFNNLKATQDFSDDSLSAVVAVDVSDDSTVYFKMVEAYKSGGFNTRDPQRDGNQGAASDGTDYGFGYAEGFAPEYVTSFELGAKTELLRHRLRINADIFFSQYDDMQLNFLLAGTVADTKVTNAGKAEMWGVETDITYLITRDLVVNLSYAWLDAEVTEATDANGLDVTDQFVFFSAPENAFSLAADYTVMASSWGRISFNLGWNYTDERNGGTLQQNIANTELRAYDLVNARLSLTDVPLGDGRLGIALWGRNVLDEEYELSAIDNLPEADRSVIWGEPASFGVDLSYEF